MSNIDKRALREAAEKATKGQYVVGHNHINQRGNLSSVYVCQQWNNTAGGVVAECHVNCLTETGEQVYFNAEFIAAANPDTVLALLDELEAKDRSLADLYHRNYALTAKIEPMDRHIAELEARSVPNAFSVIGENIRTQDNRVTSDPMFCVYQKREIVAHEEYDHDHIVWIDEDGNEATQRQKMRLELLHENFREPPEKWRRVAVKEIDEFVTCCFTEKGCKDYLACNGHNLRLPFIYVKSGFRNAEYIGIRNWLSGIDIAAGTAKGE